MNAQSHSSSELLRGLLYGRRRKGTRFGRGDLLFGDYVVALTPLGAARMPNGLECAVSLRARTAVWIGGGTLRLGRVDIEPGERWNPVPAFELGFRLPPGLEPLLGPVGLSGVARPFDGALLAGYVAGLFLLHGQRRRAENIASSRLARFDPGAGTLLLHAARGEVPEPVHALLASGNAAKLISWSPLGIAWLRGLVSAGLPMDLVSARVAVGRQTA